MVNDKKISARIGPVKIAVVLIITTFGMLSVIDKIGAAPSIKNVPTGPGSFEGVISPKPTQPYTLVFRKKAEFLKTASRDQVLLASGPVQPTQKKEKPLTYSEAFPTSGGNTTYSTTKGKVIMIKGEVITVQIDEKDWPAEMGDAVKVSFSVDGEVIPVGTWRVNIVKEGGIIEAVPYEVQGKPSIGLDAHVVSRERPKVTKGAGKENSHGLSPNDSAATYAEALMYYKGDGVLKDHKKAFGLFKEASEMGHDVAQSYMGWMLQNGEGVEKDPVMAVNWYKKAADQNNANAKNNLGIMYLNGEGVKQDYAMANKLFMEAANSGNKYGYWNLGRIHNNGWGVEKNLYTAFSYYLKASEMGHVDAQDIVCEFYLNGIGVNKDYGKAHEWCKKAADSGFARSYNQLGLICLNAYGVERDYKTAYMYFEKAANAGDKWGYFNLGRLYDNGWGVLKDEQKALEYYRKFGDHVSAYRDGARKGHEGSKEWLRKRNLDW